MGFLDKFIGKASHFAYEINDELESKGEFPERFIVKERKSSGGNNIYVLVNKNYNMDRKEISEYEIQRYYRLVNR